MPIIPDSRTARQMRIRTTLISNVCKRQSVLSPRRGPVLFAGRRSICRTRAGVVAWRKIHHAKLYQEITLIIIHLFSLGKCLKRSFLSNGPYCAKQTKYKMNFWHSKQESASSLLSKIETTLTIFLTDSSNNFVPVRIAWTRTAYPVTEIIVNGLLGVCNVHL